MAPGAGILAVHSEFKEKSNMAQRIQVLLVCDLHDDETPGTETVTFTLDGASYEIDLCEQHAAKMRERFAPYAGAGARAGEPGGEPAAGATCQAGVAGAAATAAVPVRRLGSGSGPVPRGSRSPSAVASP